MFTVKYISDKGSHKNLYFRFCIKIISEIEIKSLIKNTDVRLRFK